MGLTQYAHSGCSINKSKLYGKLLIGCIMCLSLLFELYILPISRVCTIMYILIIYGYYVANTSWDYQYVQNNILIILRSKYPMEAAVCTG